MSNQLAKSPKFSVALRTDAYQNLINNTLQDPKRAQRFIASISSAVATNPALQACDAGTILSCALLGESLNLSPSPQLGQYYLVPFKQTIKDDNGKKIGEKQVATFILGYKGYYQLAIRSGQYKKLDVVAIKKGELVKYDPMNEEIQVNLIQDELKRELAPTIGYYAFYRLQNGFEKALYWSKEKMEQHALKYSKGYAAKKGYTFWEKDFDAMALKTMIRQLISKWGIMSIEMQQAFEEDDVMGTQTNYIDNEFVEEKKSDIKKTVVEATSEIVEGFDDDYMSDFLRDDVDVEDDVISLDDI